MSPVSLYVDRIFRGVGRIRRATGTSRPAVRNKINRMLTALAEDGRVETLRSVRDGNLDLMTLYAAYQAKEIDLLPQGKAAESLAVAWTRWVREKDCGDEHRRSLMKALPYLKASEGAMVADVPVLLAAARTRLLDRATTFRLLRAACQGFIRSHLKKSHPLYAAVGDVPAMRVRPTVRRHPATVAELRLVAARMAPGHAAILWGMALTGMRPKEYWGPWSVDGHGVKIDGTKTRGAVRFVPLVSPIEPPRLAFVTFRHVLRVASDRQMSPYDLRRTYSNWIEGAGIQRTRRRLYMGHGNKDLTDLYEWHEVTAFLADDAAKIRAFVGSETPGLKIAK